MSKNKYGVSRDIPATVRREVRQRSGFGCVICRTALCEYHHFDPHFEDLKKEHNADGIALLCPTCHTKAGRREISEERVKARYYLPDKEPAHYEPSLDRGAPISLVIGQQVHKDRFVVRAEGVPLLEFERGSGHELLLSVALCDELGEPVCQIEQNAFVTSARSSLDFDWENRQFKWKRVGRGSATILHMQYRGETNALHLLELDTWVRGTRFSLAPDGTMRVNEDRPGWPLGGHIGVGAGGRVEVVGCLFRTTSSNGESVTQEIAHMIVDRSKSEAPRTLCPCGSGLPHGACCERKK